MTENEKKMEKNKEDEVVWARKFERAYPPVVTSLIIFGFVYYIFSLAEIWPFGDPWHDPWFYGGMAFLAIAIAPAVWSLFKDKNDG